MLNNVPDNIPKANNLKMIRVVLTDDHPVVRKAIKTELLKEPDFEIVAEAADGEEAVKLVTQYSPDIVIMDIGMPRLNGIEATRQIKAVRPDTLVLVLTIHDDTEHILGILESGADGYLTKNILVEDIIKAMRSALAGEAVLSPFVFQQVLKYALKNITKPVQINIGGKLTFREQEILKALSRGKSNKQIAQELNIGVRTVKSHLVDIFSKLNVVSRTEAIITALRCGFLNIDDLD